MKAAEARALSTSSRYKIVSEEYEKIQKLITEEAMSGSGNFHITVFCEISNETMEMLTKDGYTIIPSEAGFNEINYKISWA